jgi:hypothetical protein
VLPVAPIIRTFTFPPLSFFPFLRAVVLFVSNLHVLSRLGELSGSSAALRGSVATRRRIFRPGGWLCILVSVFKQMAKALVGGGRFFFGASFLLAPSPILRIWWPDDAASGPIALGLARGLGARDAALGLGILAAVLRRESSGGWLLAAAGADAADLILTLTNAWPFGRRTRLLTLAGTALYVMVELYLAFDQEN